MRGGGGELPWDMSFVSLLICMGFGKKKVGNKSESWIVASGTLHKKAAFGS